MKDTYIEGIRSFLNNVPVQQNPYEKETINHHNWQTGWIHACSYPKEKLVFILQNS